MKSRLLWVRPKIIATRDDLSKISEKSKGKIFTFEGEKK